MSEEGNQTELIILTPGERIALYENAKPILAGIGTYLVNDSELFSSRIGKLEYNKEKNEYKVTNPNKLDEDVVPLVHSEVIGKVIKVNSKMAEVQILAVGETPLVRSFKGTIRKENVRAFEIDQIEMFDCFRLGDVVRRSRFFCCGVLTKTRVRFAVLLRRWVDFARTSFQRLEMIWG